MPGSAAPLTPIAVAFNWAALRDAPTGMLAGVDHMRVGATSVTVSGTVADVFA